MGNVFQIASREEWERIIDYLLREREGRWHIKCRCQVGCNHEWEGTVRTYEDLPRFFLEDIRPCPFLKAERDDRGRFTGRTRCEVYPVRPSICLHYPFQEADALKYGCRGFLDMVVAGPSSRRRPGARAQLTPA